jgi:hypothetical protein
MKQGALLKILKRYDWLLPSFILLAVNNIVFYFKRPELGFSLVDYSSSIILSILFWGWLYSLGSIFPERISHSTKVAAVFLFGLVSSVNYLVYIEFGQFISFAMICFLNKYPDYYKSFALLYLKEYWFLFPIFSGPILFFWLQKSNQALKNNSLIYFCLITPIIFFLTFKYSNILINKNILMPDVTTLISSVKYLIKNENQGSQSEKLEREKLPIKQTQYKMPDVYIIMNESLGRNIFRFDNSEIYNSSMPFLMDFVNKNSNEWFTFNNSLSSSTATDVSIPSFATGLSPTAEKSLYYKMPLIWNFLEALCPKYYTIFSSPVDFKWANLEKFLDLNKFDKYIQAKNLPGGIINDLGKDEFYSAQAFANAIKEVPPNQPIFGFYFSNSLHSPFQNSSVYFNSTSTSTNSNSTRFSAAQKILDYAIKDIINSIIDTGRINNSLIFIIGDHGETDKPHASGHRLYSFREEYWSSLLLVYASKSIQNQYKEEFKYMRSNANSLVSTLDIYPSLIDLFCANENLSWLKNNLNGLSLFQTIPNDRILIGLSTNCLRSWPQEGFGIAKGHSRMIYDNVNGFFLYDLKSDQNQQNDIINFMQINEKEDYIKVIKKNNEILRVLSTNAKLK